MLHSLIGLKMSLFLGFVCLTGTIATVAHEIEWLADPAVRAHSDGRTDDYAAMWGVVRAKYPDAWISSLGTFDRADSSYFAREATIVLPSGEERRLLIDPQSLAIQGERTGHSFHFIMRGLHYYLLLPTEWPFYLVTALGFVLLAMLITGLVTYKKFWRGFLRMPRWQRSTRTWSGDVHRLVGLWSLWFVAIMAVTSIWYFFERALPSMETEPPAAMERTMLATPDPATVERWLAIARREFPGLSVTFIQMPYGSDDPVVIQGQWQAHLVRERTNAVFIDPVTGELLGKRVAHELSAVERWVHTADPLHFGNFAGLAGKLAWALFGLAMTALCVTGAVIFTKRSASAARGLRAR